MKIKVKKDCWTSNPERKWSVGEVEVSDELAIKLLRNNNFEKAETEKAKAKSKLDKK